MIQAEPLVEREVTDRLLFINGLLVDLLVLPKVRRASDELTTLISEIAFRGVGTPAEAAKDFQ